MLGSVPASEFFVALTITMTRIAVLLSNREVEPARNGRDRLLLPWRRTAPTRIDTIRDLA